MTCCGAKIFSMLFSHSESISSFDSEDLKSCISHELRTPLTSIRGALRLLQEGCSENRGLGALSEEGHHLLTIALHNADRLLRLANAIEHEPVMPMTLLSPAKLTELQLSNDLYSAFEGQELQLFYQPIICVETNEVSGFEASVRWQHPRQGWITPAVFTSLVEKAGLVNQLGIWSVRQACYQLQQWQQCCKNPCLKMVVNLSSLQLLQPHLVQQIEQILQDTQIVPGCLKLQLAEVALIQANERVATVISQLRSLGVQFHIDNFSHNCIALEYLQDLPIVALKINRSVRDRKRNFSEMLLLLAAKLGFEAIVEGVETAEELDLLKALGCKQIQGYFFSAPVNSETASHLLFTSLPGYGTNNG